MASSFKKYDLEEQFKTFGVELNQLTQEIEKRAKEGMKILQQQIYGKIVEKANEKLKSTRHIYIANLGMINESDNLYVVYLKKDAAWIEDGVKPHDMLPYLTSGPKSRIAKDGSRYNIIPFKHNKPPEHTSRAQMKIQEIVKHEIKKRGLDKPIKIGGRPIIGRAYSFKDLLTGPEYPVSKQGKPLLAGLTIYQKAIRTKSGKMQIHRDVMTFRVASTKQAGTGLWQHPGLKGANLFSEVEKEVDEMWHNMLRDIINSIKIERVER